MKTKTIERKKSESRLAKKLQKKTTRKIQNLKKEYLEAANLLNIRNEIGRPRLETDQGCLMQAICDIALHSGSADDKRRSEAIRACKTLSDLHEQMNLIGYKLSKSSLYLRLIPRSSISAEGKRHVITVPIKLCRAQADIHKDHADQHFCRASINGLEEVASILGPHQVC